MVNTYAAQSGGCRFESLWGFGFSLKGAYYEVGYCGKKTFLAGLQGTLTSSCAKITAKKRLDWCRRRSRQRIPSKLDFSDESTFVLYPKRKGFAWRPGNASLCPKYSSKTVRLGSKKNMVWGFLKYDGTRGFKKHQILWIPGSTKKHWLRHCLLTFT